MSESVAEGGGEGGGFGGGANDGEFWEVEAHGSGSWAFAENDVEAEIFHGGIKDLFDCGSESVNFVNEKDFARLEGSQDGGEVGGFFDDGARSESEGRAHFFGDDVGKGGFSKSWRS